MCVLNILNKNKQLPDLHTNLVDLNAQTTNSSERSCKQLTINSLTIEKQVVFYYAPNFEEVEGAYWFGSVLAVSQSVSL